METLHGQIFALYLFDVAEATDLQLAAADIGGSVRSKFTAKPATPAYVKYQQPPLIFEGAAVDVATVDGFRVAFKLFDYGVISLRLTRDFDGTWPELAAISNDLVENEALERQAEQACRTVALRLRKALTKPRQTALSEDYLVIALNGLSRPHKADDLIEHHGDVIASLLRGERAQLSGQERDEILRHRISYLADDLVIPTWNAAFVYDTPAGTQAALEIVEFANSQLLQFRYYDELLDNALASIYANLQRDARWYDMFLGRHYARAARQVHALFIDVNELTDRTENALKIVGDVYAARLFALVGARLDLGRWKTSVGEKLKTLDDIYRFSVEHLGMVRGEFLEATIVAILIFELVLFFMGIMN
ncbi:MAG: hypothetical protein EHM55_25835 [Acidobacteria bacterium]|nr:MAG: hypothetical protein EHM55_25835 [Acidobacteriota bacterium]